VKIGVMGRPEVVMGGGAVTARWCGGGWVVYGGVMVVFGRRENGDGEGEVYSAGGENEGEKGKVT
jgi:hypothetical protein